MTTAAFIRTAHADRLMDLLEATQNGPVSVPECRLRVTRPAVIREMVNRGMILSVETARH